MMLLRHSRGGHLTQDDGGVVHGWGFILSGIEDWGYGSAEWWSRLEVGRRGR